jgi:hypothetical protein
VIQLRGGEAEFCGLFAAKLFEADFLDHARRAAAKAAQSPATAQRHRLAGPPLHTPIFFRYDPMQPPDPELVLWYRSDKPGGGAPVGNTVRAYLRWFDCHGRILVWQSEPVILDPAEPRYWQPVLVHIPVSARQNSWLRFDVLAASQDAIVPSATGFLLGAGWSDFPPVVRRDVLACTSAGQPAPLPNEVPASAGGQCLTDGGTDFATPAKGPLLIKTEALGDIETLFFVDWGCFGKRLATARIPSPALSGAHQLLLPGKEAGARVFGLSRAAGMVPIVTQALDQAVPGALPAGRSG